MDQGWISQTGHAMSQADLGPDKQIVSHTSDVPRSNMPELRTSIRVIVDAGHSWLSDRGFGSAGSLRSWQGLSLTRRRV